MSKYKALDLKEDSKSGWVNPSNFFHAANKPAVTISINEIANLISQYPFAFAKNNEGEFKLVALLGFFEDENLFINKQGFWIGGKVPQYYKYYPFSLQEVKDQKNKVLCFDMESELYIKNPNKKNEHPFFNKKGELADLTKSIIEKLKENYNFNIITQKALNTLAKYDLFTPLKFNLQFKEEKREVLDGFYMIDQKKLNNLDANALKNLQYNNALSIVYTQIFSLNQIEFLKKLYDLKYKKINTKKAVSENIDKVFGKKEEEFSFNFDNL